MNEEKKTNHQYFGGMVEIGEIAPFVLVPGSKERVIQFTKYWDHSEKIADYREYLIYTGVYCGVSITACSTGIGGTAVNVAVEDLISLGAHTLIRVGVTGTLQEDISVGDVTLASAAIRADRISSFFVPPEIPALSSHEALLALSAACQKHNYRFHIGVTATNGTFYCGEGRPGAKNYSQSFMGTIVDDFVKSGVLDWDTETATLFSTAIMRGARAGRINGVLDSPRTKEKDPKAEERAVIAALDALLILAEWDQKKKVIGQYLLLPDHSKEIKPS